MKFAVFAYNFPHWKTQNGLFNLVMNGFRPSIVILQDKKELNVPQSLYRITPRDEYLIEPLRICRNLELPFCIREHDTVLNVLDCDFGVILGARILKQHTIDQFPKGILNIHPGILPGNRGLDNLKHAILKGLPIGVTAHFIDSHIDMGHIVAKTFIPVYPDESIRDLYNRQRNAEQELLIDVMQQFKDYGIHYKQFEKCGPSEKFGIVEPSKDYEFNYNYTIRDYGKHITTHDKPVSVNEGNY